LKDSISAYREDGGPLEGLYLRREVAKTGDKKHPAGDTSEADMKYLESRCKLVRADFVAAIGEHWSKATPKKNVVVYG